MNLLLLQKASSHQDYVWEGSVRGSFEKGLLGYVIVLFLWFEGGGRVDVGGILGIGIGIGIGIWVGWGSGLGFGGKRGIGGDSKIGCRDSVLFLRGLKGGWRVMNQ
jgi:hypothetical protein